MMMILETPTPTPAAIRALIVPCTAASTRTTRTSESGALRPPRRRLAGSQRHFSFRAVAGWNALSQTARAAKSLGAFKRAIMS